MFRCYRYDYLVDNDAIKTLSVVRKKFFEDNNGIEKKERLFPAKIVKKIFKDASIEKVKYETKKTMKYRNCGSLYIGGTGDMFLCKDKLGADYIFKPAYRKNTDIYQPYRAIAQVLASKLQECISPQTAVRCEYYEINEKKGTIQPKISVLEELREALTELNAIPNEEYMKKFESYINLIDVDSKQKDLIYSNILLRKKNINAVLEVLKIKLDEKTQNDEVEL